MAKGHFSVGFLEHKVAEKNVKHRTQDDTTLFLILYRRQVVEVVTECTLD